MNISRAIDRSGDIGVTSAACEGDPCAEALAAINKSIDKFASKLINDWVDKLHNTWSLHRIDVDNTTLGKSSHLTVLASQLPGFQPRFQVSRSLKLSAFRFPSLVAFHPPGLSAWFSALSAPGANLSPNGARASPTQASRLPDFEAFQPDLPDREAGAERMYESETKLIELLRLKRKTLEDHQLNFRMQMISTPELDEAIDGAIEELELSDCETPNLQILRGTKWRLIYSDDDTTRSSPFFWAFRKAVRDRTSTDTIFAFTDGMPFKKVGDAIQSFEGDELISQVKLDVDFLGSGLMTTTSKWKPVESQRRPGMMHRMIEIKVQTTQVLESTIASRFPFLDDMLSFPSGDALELTAPGSSTIYATVTYLSENIRITRNEDKVFVFERLQKRGRSPMPQMPSLERKRLEMERERLETQRKRFERVWQKSKGEEGGRLELSTQTSLDATSISTLAILSLFIGSGVTFAALYFRSIS